MDKQFLNIEIYHNGQDTALMINQLDNNTAREFSPDMKDFVKLHHDLIKERYPRAYNMLLDNYPKGSCNWKYNIVRRFFRCNFFINDSKPDIDINGNYNVEVVPCPMRGDCSAENIICKPTLNTKLSDRELEVALLLANNHRKETIADMLFISVFTVENHRRNIYTKLGIHNIGELVDYLHVNKLFHD